MKLSSIKHWSNKKLVKEFKQYDGMIFDVECFGVGDLILHAALNAEMDKRKLPYE